MKNHIYAAIDLKTFYASVECVERGLDPLDTNLVVADESRTEKTICLAVSPSLKAYGLAGRSRLFEVIAKVKQINAERQRRACGHSFSGSSFIASELKENADLSLDFIIAPPRMAYYIEYSTKIYDIYLRYIAPEDIHVYSIDEVFIDLTNYLFTYKTTAHELTMNIIRDVLKATGITATAGIGTNLYLAKIAMDIVAKHAEPDKDGVRIAKLDEKTYRRLLWNHRPITDFWRVGSGYAKKLAENGLFTMGDIARCSIGKSTDFHNEELLYSLFGINAELLIDHAWGREPCTIPDIKSYRPENNSISSGQVLMEPYTCEKARTVVREMAEALSLDLVDKELVTNQIVITIGYDKENLKNAETKKAYKGAVKKDRYGRAVPVHAHGTENLHRYTSSSRLITKAAMELYERITDPKLLIRRINITANRVIDENTAENIHTSQQLDLFTDYDALIKQKEAENKDLKKEKDIQKAVLNIKKKFGKNAVLKGTSFREGATARDRNRQIGGHKA